MKIKTIKELLTETEIKYVIPFYQRNFAWTYDEIEQLIVDILDSIEDKKNEYYIGTLVLCPNEENKNECDIIDGQQRFTAVLLLCLAIQNKYEKIIPKQIDKLNLSFKARKKSNETLKYLLSNIIIDASDKSVQNNEILIGYKHTIDILNDRIGKELIIEFFNTFFNKVKLFIDVMPIKTDKNLYFERFNSRGEQLEAHEIIKAEFMQKLTNDGCEIKTVQKFAKIWDACSQFETPCIKFFKKKIKGSDQDNERERVFDCKWFEYEPGKNSWQYGYNFKNIFQYIMVNNENKQSLLEALEKKENDLDKENVVEEIDSVDKYRCIINFNTFLYYVLYITDNTNEVQFDD